ncbi:MAG: DapH/DapD/GlmU-related protein [Promethearchaeota archaeon]|jgi:acetyltransferase-like isoleucine patch superfamily enzyme
MSVPNTMRVGPFTPTILAKKRYLIFYILLIWASIIPLLLEFWFYWRFLWYLPSPVHFYTYLPLLAFLMYVTIVFSAIFFTKILLVIINAIHKPKEGTFLRHPADKDFRYWSLRNTIKRWPVWLAHRFPFPGILDNICFKAFGVKTKISNSLFEGWVDTEFIEFGKDVVVGQGSIIQGAVIIGNLLIIRKTIIEDNVRIGSHAIVMPGTHIGHNCILAANSVTTVGQVLERGWIYVGIPAKKFKVNYFFEDGLEDKLGHVEDIEALRERYEEIYTKRYDELSHKERKELKKEKKEEEKKRWEP